MKNNIILLVLSTVLTFTSGNTSLDSDSDEVKLKTIDVERLMNNFKVNFEVDKNMLKNANGTVINGNNSTSANFNGTVINGLGVNGTSVDGIMANAQNNDADEQFNNMIKKVFGGGSDKNKKKRYSKNGNQLKYYRDDGVPMLLRKVIPPSGDKLPALQFEYVEGNSTCRCTCKL